MKMPGRRFAIMAVIGVLAGCGGPSPTSPPATASPSEAPPSAAAPTIAVASSAPSAGEPTSAPGVIADEPGTIALEVVVEGLRSPIGFATGPDGTVLVHERDGLVVSIAPTGEPSPFLDLGDRVLGGGEQGLLGIALHPDWPSVAEAFVHYSDLDGNTVVSRFGVSDLPSPPQLDPATEQVLLRVEQPFSNHNGGQLAFGADRMLYLGLGDGGSGGDPLGHGQDTTTLLGSVLRLDVLGASGEEGYAIPADNPFATGGGAPEVFLYGLRNPWRFSFDPATGAMWIADVGQEAWEEIDRIDPVADAGANLGWNVMEGTHCFGESGCNADGLVPPVAEYDHGAGCSVTGGAVYRGSAIPTLWGWYVFSDFCSGTLFGVRSDVAAPAPGQPAATPRVLLETDASVSAFGLDADGELLLADIGAGTVYRIVGG